MPCKNFSSNIGSRWTSSLIGCALLLLAPVSLLAQSPPQLSQSENRSDIAITQTATAPHSRNATALAQGQWNAGFLSALDADQITHTFTLKNQTAGPLIISRLQTSCDCTSAVAATDKGAASLPLLLAPGQSLTTRVSVDLARVAPGEVLKSVLVYIQESPSPVAMLQVTGTLRPSLSLSPSLLNFGQVPVSQKPALSQTRSLSVTATWDERLTPGGTLPPLVSTNPDVTVIPQPEIVAVPPKTPGPAPFLHRGIRTRIYQVTISPSAALGPLSGVLSFQAPAQMPHTKTKSFKIRLALQSAIFAQPTVLLLGQVQGDLAAQPQTLMFGRILLGQEASREIVLTGTHPEPLKGLIVSSASPWIAAHLSPATPIFSGGQLQPGSQALDVTLSPNTPPGLLTSTLKVTLANGQHLRVPVTADVGSTRF